MVFDSRLFGHRDMMHWNASVEVDISDAVPLFPWLIGLTRSCISRGRC